jgi:Fe-Mn family superoxide dismutase
MSTVQGDYAAKSYDSLIGNLPGIDDQVLKMHFKLYQGYVANTNKLLSSLKDMEKNGKLQTPEYAGLKRMFGWEWDGMRLHEFYFDNLGGNTKKLDPDSDLAKAIDRDFDSYDKWEKDFRATGLIRGIGWSILYLDGKTGRLMNTWINEHDLGHLAGGTPILIMDVFEHAYITQYGLDRAKYIDAFFNNINWDVALQRFSEQQSR